jgi:CheY-like chemotaxis protein
MMKILIADHDPVSRRISELVFDEWGHDVMTARDSRHALEILQPSGAPRLVISDTMIPDTDGLKLCGEISGKKRKEDIYFVYSYSKKRKEQNDQTVQSRHRCLCQQAV